MDPFYNTIDLPFVTPRKRKLHKYAILLNEPNEKKDELTEQICSLASELLPVEPKPVEDLVEILGELLQGKIKSHSDLSQVPIFKADDIIKKNASILVPVMYRIACEDFAQSNGCTFKIIECRNVTKLVSDWKPSLPDKLISLGHQVVVVQLEESFVPYSDFVYAVLRQLDYDWKIRLPRSFFFPDDVCKVEGTPDWSLCVISPSMPDGDLEINKKMGQLNYELLTMIKSSCMSAMKNYLMKRDLRVGKLSDTLDGVSALRQLYRKLQEHLRAGQEIELGSNSLDDLKKLAKDAMGTNDVLTAHTWIEYGSRMGLNIPASASSSATSINSACHAVEDSDVDGAGDDDALSWIEDDDDEDTGAGVTTLSSSGFDVNGGKEDCQNHRTSILTTATVEHSTRSCRNDVECVVENTGGVLLLTDAPNGDTTTAVQGSHYDALEEPGREVDEEDEGRDLKLEDFTDFKDSLARIHNTRKEEEDRYYWEPSQTDEDDFAEHEFSASSILQILPSSRR